MNSISIIIMPCINPSYDSQAFQSLSRSRTSQQTTQFSEWIISITWKYSAQKPGFPTRPPLPLPPPPLHTHTKPSLLGNLDTCVCQDLLQNIQLLKDLKCCTKQRSLPSFQFFKKISSSLRFSCFLLFFFFSSSHSFFYFFLLFLLF